QVQRLPARRLAAVPGTPATVAPPIVFGVPARGAELPLPRPPSNMEPKRSGNLSGQQQKPRQLVPPEVTAPPEKSRGHEAGRRPVVTAEQRLGMAKIVGISVVEGHHDAPARHRAASESLDERPERQRPGQTADDLQMLRKVLGRDGELPRIDVGTG